ncbi:hypothetical protein AAG570_009966 [Ranatra chinensis]|uniref:SUZ RNA-binding domain-containing n=1 Tax=Ranatra chinensis TaxID=642074 RepID=A0ABD0Z3J6_9HEMI
MAQEPSVKILRRPTNGCDNLHVNDAKPKQPIKTLQQREIEYAKARLRILGSARSPEENLEDATVALEERIQKIQPKPQILRPPSTCIGIIRVPRGPDGSPGFNFRR